MSSMHATYLQGQEGAGCARLSATCVHVLEYFAAFGSTAATPKLTGKSGACRRCLVDVHGDVDLPDNDLQISDDR